MSAKPAYLNADLPVEERISDLLSRMTLEEKAAQLTMLPNSWGDGPSFMKDGVFHEPTARENMGPHGVGSLHQREDKTSPRSLAEATNAVQKYMIEKTRLGIPALIICESLHGNAAPNCTIFPQALALSSSWNPGMVRAIGDKIARECRSCGSTSGLSPVLDIGREPRWGRMEEGYGEDPYLCSRMGVAMVKGMQGDGPPYDSEHIIATPKHFAGHGAPLGGRDSHPVGYGREWLREFALPSFEAAVREAKAGSVMAAYSDWCNVPCNASRELLTDILREEWGFQGYVIEDMGAIGLLVQSHSVAADYEDAVRLAVSAGVDQSFGGAVSEQTVNLVRAGKLSEATVDEACRRILRAKILLGLFENPYVDPDVAESLCGCADHRGAAREAARQCVVLLKNDNALLPLSKSLKTIAVIGPNAAVMETGDYSGWMIPLVSPLDGIRRAVSADTNVLYAEGCKVVATAEHPGPVPASALTPRGKTRGLAPQAGVSGLLGEYFDNCDLAGEPKLERVDQQVSFIPEYPSPALFEGIPARYSARWSGVITTEASGNYRLGLKHSDGVRLTIDGVQLIDAWSTGPVSTHTAEARLSANVRHEIVVEHFNSTDKDTCILSWQSLEPATGGIAEAAEIARKADVAVVFVGDCIATCGEVRDRAFIGLSGGQDQLVRAVVETGTPTVLVHIGGRPLTMEWEFDHVGAALTAWYPGCEGGNAIADVLFGDHNPGGKLPVTWPAYVGQLPQTYDEPVGGRGIYGGYIFSSGDPRFVFGHGLSYTAFVYSNLRVPQSVKMGQTVKVSVDVTNTGTRGGAEVVQLYIRDLLATVKRPRKQLKGFERVELQPGQTRTVQFELEPNALSLLNVKMERVVEPGDFLIMLGGSSKTALEEKFTVEE
jgi:beta-glucosidase